MVEATCPICATVNRIDDELMGRYTLCEKCRCRFYVNVPRLGEQLRPGPPATGIRESPTRETTLDDLLWDTQQGAKYVIQAVFKHGQELQRLRWTIFALMAIALANLAATIMLLAR